MTAIPSGNERLFEQGLHVRGELGTASAVGGPIIPMYEEETGALRALAADEILVIDSLTIINVDQATVQVYFDNGGTIGTEPGELIESGIFPANNIFIKTYNSRSAPKSQAGGVPRLLAGAGQINVTFKGFIRKIITKEGPGTTMAITEGNERLFQQGLHVRGELGDLDVSAGMPIVLYNEQTGAVHTMLADEILVVDSLTFVKPDPGAITIFFDNDGGMDFDAGEVIEYGVFPSDTVFTQTYEPRSAPKSQAGGIPHVIAVVGQINITLKGFIRKVVTKTNPIGP